MLAHERLLLLEKGHCLRSGVGLLPTGDAGGARASVRRASPPSCRASPMATASYPCRKFGGVTFACCISLRRSQNARSGPPGERPRRARRTFRLCEVAQGRDAAPRQA
jgi:hypothetical protein